MTRDPAGWLGGDKAMPSEVRTITFRQAEVVQALNDYGKRKGQPLPKGTLFRFSAEANDSVHVSLAIAVDGEDRLETVSFTSKEIGAALVMYCMKSKNSSAFARSDQGATDRRRLCRPGDQAERRRRGAVEPHQDRIAKPPLRHPWLRLSLRAGNNS